MLDKYLKKRFLHRVKVFPKAKVGVHFQGRFVDISRDQDLSYVIEDDDGSLLFLGVSSHDLCFDDPPFSISNEAGKGGKEWAAPLGKNTELQKPTYDDLLGLLSEVSVLLPSLEDIHEPGFVKVAISHSLIRDIRSALYTSFMASKLTGTGKL